MQFEQCDETLYILAAHLMWLITFGLFNLVLIWIDEYQILENKQPNRLIDLSSSFNSLLNKGLHVLSHKQFYTLVTMIEDLYDTKHLIKSMFK